MPGNPGGIRRGDSSLLNSLGILGQVADCSACRGILQDGVTGILRGDAGGPSITHHIQCGGGCSGLTLVIGGGRESRQAVQVRTVGMTSKRPLLRR